LRCRENSRPGRVWAAGGRLWGLRRRLGERSRQKDTKAQCRDSRSKHGLTAHGAAACFPFFCERRDFQTPVEAGKKLRCVTQCRLRDRCRQDTNCRSQPFQFFNLQGDAEGVKESAVWTVAIYPLCAVCPS